MSDQLEHARRDIETKLSADFGIRHVATPILKKAQASHPMCREAPLQVTALVSLTPRPRRPISFDLAYSYCNSIPGDVVRKYDDPFDFHSKKISEVDGENVPLTLVHTPSTTRRTVPPFGYRSLQVGAKCVLANLASQ